MTRMDVIAPSGGGFRDYGSSVQIGSGFWSDFGAGFVKGITLGQVDISPKTKILSKYLPLGKKGWLRPAVRYVAGTAGDVVGDVAGTAKEGQEAFEKKSGGVSVGDVVSTATLLKGGGKGGNMSGFAPLPSLVQQQISPWTSVGSGIKV